MSTLTIHDIGCPICGEDNADQLAHVMADHSWHERWRLYWQTRQHMRELLISRKHASAAPPVADAGGRLPVWKFGAGPT